MCLNESSVVSISRCANANLSRMRYLCGVVPKLSLNARVGTTNAQGHLLRKIIHAQLILQVLAQILFELAFLPRRQATIHDHRFSLSRWREECH